MLSFIKPYLALAVAFAIIAIALVIWFSGVHHGGAYVQARWDRQKIVDAQVVTDEQAKRISEEHRYEIQLRTASDLALAHRAELDRLRAAPHPRLVCQRAPEGRGGALSAIPAGPAALTPRNGLLSQAPGQDIANDLYVLVDDADEAIETARNALAQVPKL